MSTAFPHQLAWLIDNPLRKLLLDPARFVDRLALAADAHVLELGPGSGFFSVELARRLPAGRLTLVDIQPQMLAKARRKLIAAGYDRIAYVAADAARPFPFLAGQFDLALLVTVLGEIPDPDVALSSLAGALKPHGMLVIHEQIPDPDRVPLGRLRPLVERHGFRLQWVAGPAWNYTAAFVRA